MEKDEIIKKPDIKDIKKNLNKKDKILSISFVRALSSLGILIFHYFCHSNGNFKFLYGTANSNWGFMFSTTFFCISGTVLYYNYPKIESIKIFYYKRWKSIFPSYYICFLYFFINTAFNKKQLFYNGHWTKLFLTLIGLDGYLKYRFNSYYLIGEWFLGAIIIIYFLYPLILFIMDINIFIIYIIIGIGFILMYKTNIFIIQKNNNIITCLNSFYFGMISMKFKKFYFNNSFALIFSLLLLVFLSKVKIYINAFILVFQLQSFSLYILLMQTGIYIMSKKYAGIFHKISKISLSIYLIHHRLIINILELKNPFEWYLHLSLLTLTVLLTIICSKIHLMVVDYVIKSYLFEKLDSFFLI